VQLIIPIDRQFERFGHQLGGHAGARQGAGIEHIGGDLATRQAPRQRLCLCDAELSQSAVALHSADDCLHIRVGFAVTDEIEVGCHRAPDAYCALCIASSVLCIAPRPYYIRNMSYVFAFTTAPSA
jgi:hypothetical protein